MLLADGGDPETIESGGTQLAAAAKVVGSTGQGLDHAGGLGGGCGDPTLEAAIKRYTAAASAMSSALQTQIGAAAELARNASADLNAAGGN